MPYGRARRRRPTRTRRAACGGPRPCGSTLRGRRTQPSGVRITWLRTRPRGPATSRSGLGIEAEHALVEQHRLVEVLPALRHVDVVDRACDVRALGVAVRELVEPARVRALVAEQDLGAVRRRGRGQVLLARVGLAEDRWRVQLAGPGQRRAGVGDLEPERREVGRLIAAALVVEDHTGPSRRPEPHGLGAVPAAEGEAELLQHQVGLVEPGAAELDEVEALGWAHGRQWPPGGDVVGTPDLVREPDQRSVGVGRRTADVGLAEDVVEHLERQRPRVAGGEHVAEEAREVEAALAREETVVAAPREHVHVECGCVGELEVEDLLARDLLDVARVVAARQDVERVEAHADVRVVGTLDDAPGAAVVVDVACPTRAPRRQYVPRTRRPARRARAAGGRTPRPSRSWRWRRCCTRGRGPCRGGSSAGTSSRRAAGCRRTSPRRRPRSRGTAGRGRATDRAGPRGCGSPRATRTR